MMEQQAGTIPELEQLVEKYSRHLPHYAELAFVLELGDAVCRLEELKQELKEQDNDT